MAMGKKSSGASNANRSTKSESGSMVEPEVLERIVRILGQGGFAFLEWQRGDERLVLRRDAEVVSSATTHLAPPTVRHAVVASLPSSGEGAQPPASAEAPKPLSGTVVTSPFVGTFYRAPSPDAQSFVEVGQAVRKGQVLCIIEAMKLMNEIEAEIAGKVTEVIAQNGQTVEFGQPLFRIELT